MIVVVDSDGEVSLDDATVFTSFAVRSEVGDGPAVVEAMAGDAHPAPEHDHVFVEIDAVRRLAGPVADDKWEAELASMVTFAGANGWLNQQGDAIKAHIEHAEVTD